VRQVEAVVEDERGLESAICDEQSAGELWQGISMVHGTISQ
jgi:hypothetical protein